MSKRKKKRAEEHENHERWLVSYADFITLLFAFFVVMYATSKGDVEKQKSFEDSIKKYLNKITAVSIGGNSTDLSESKSSSPLSNPIQSWRKIYTKKDKEIEQLLERVESYLDQNLTGSQKEQILFGIQDTDWGVKVSLSADKVFAHESAKINREAVAPLLAVGRLLKELNHGVIIENHYGNEPIKNNQYPSAWELTSMRSTKLLRFLMQQQSLSAEKMTAAGFANSRLISSSSQKVDKARNRRVDILILNENDFY